ncbi:protein translocase subunit SecF [Suttonella sp. R2A3]|uniref:protein translocase subunit SecF n=1 Tax=Suttonella sp. R2A3 TaxID=2908648 RepID=UPI001F3E6C63|nr:protein translocase subunit SecF [Suttonella sp. R2A3]UJF24673.1 protein translocase subunit SecF [Suttonella sp. R2A3]
MNHANKGLWFSLALTTTCVVLIFLRGFNFGLEFTGGATIELNYPQVANIAEIRQTVDQIHPDASVVQYGSSRDVQIRFAEKEGISSDDMMGDIVAELRSAEPEVRLVGQSKIGGQYKTELIEKGITAFIFATIGMILYLSLRFEWKFAVGAVLAQVHDVIVTAGLFALTQWTFDLTVLAALLAVLGYSVNDTVVVYDRIRENFRNHGNETPRSLIDLSINQTLARTVVTGLTTLLAVVALLIFGGETLFGFSAAMIFGVVFGTYSSIFVASSLVDRLGVKHVDLLPKEKEAVDELP